MYSDHHHLNHEYAEALQSRFSLEKPPSSSAPSPNTTMTNTTINDTAPVSPHDVRNGFHNTAAAGAPTSNASANTSSSIITSSNEPSNDFLNTGSGMAINTSSCSGLLVDSTGALTGAGFQATSSGGDHQQLVASSGSSPGSTDQSCLDSAQGSSKRKRDWMNSLAQPLSGTMDNTGKNVASNKSSSSLLTSVRITNGLYSFPAGWEQYLDLQTGETYYVNWNTRTKHCRVQCPEVQRCLAGVQQQQQHAYSNCKVNTSNKESVESWLSKMTATTSALVNNKPPFVSKPPLPPSRPTFKPSKHPHPTLDLTIKMLPNINSTHSGAFTPTTVDAITSPHDMQNAAMFMPAQMRDFACFNPSNEAIHNSLLSPKSYPNANFESASTSLEVASTPIEPLAFVCSNCNKLVMISSLNPMMQCPNCNHAINNKWSEDITSSPCDMTSLNALPLLEASSKARCH